MNQSALGLTRIAGRLAVILAVCLVPMPGASQKTEGDAHGNTAVSHILDGKKFIGQTGERGKKAHHEDILSFSDGIFTSAACLQSGFGSGVYTALIDSDGIHFEAEIISPAHGKLAWKGTLRGDILDVTYTWSKKRWFWTILRQYWFKGRIAQ